MVARPAATARGPAPERVTALRLPGLPQAPARRPPGPYPTPTGADAPGNPSPIPRSSPPFPLPPPLPRAGENPAPARPESGPKVPGRRTESLLNPRLRARDHEARAPRGGGRSLPRIRSQNGTFGYGTEGTLEIVRDRPGAEWPKISPMGRQRHPPWKKLLTPSCFRGFLAGADVATVCGPSSKKSRLRGATSPGAPEVFFHHSNRPPRQSEGYPVTHSLKA